MSIPLDAPTELPAAAPVSEGRRIVAVDVLRGFALLGILVVNVAGYGMVSAAYFNPSANGSLDGTGVWVWAATTLFAEQKFLSIFSMLFGAGIAMQSTRLARRGVRRAAALHRRRQLWLLFFGLAHAYLIWHGDILVAYALCGFLLFRFRNARPKRLLTAGALGVAVFVPVVLAAGAIVRFITETERVAAEAEWAPAEADLEAETEAFRGAWTDQMPFRAREALDLQVFGFPFYFLWRAGGLMLVGMALYRLGILSGSRPTKFYWRMTAIGLAAGLPIEAAGVATSLLAAFSLESLFYGVLFNYIGSVGMAMAYVGLVMIAVRSGWLPRLRQGLAAVGKMALTNYIGQSILCTFFFYGHGFAMFERVSPAGQLGVVLAVWILQMAWSPWWLRRFRFGPLEWIWRTLAYMQRQPMRV